MIKNNKILLAAVATAATVLTTTIAGIGLDPFNMANSSNSAQAASPYSSGNSQSYSEKSSSGGSSSSSSNNMMMTHSAMSAEDSTTSSSSMSKSHTKVFYLFNAEIPAINETKLGFTGNVYSLQTMVVNKGDTVVIHFYNVETDPAEHHSFTLGAPYNINIVLAGGQNDTITFTANKAGIFEYHCIFHPPEMRGQLVVLPW